MEIWLPKSFWRNAIKVCNWKFSIGLMLNFINVFLKCREFVPSQPSDACRLHGTLQLTKVAGNFHITAGKVLPLPMRAHAHLSPMMDDERFNYSHRIDKFSFGHSSTLIQPLEGDEVITDKGLVILSIFNGLRLIFNNICRSYVIPIFCYRRANGNRITCFRFIRNSWLNEDVAIFSSKPIENHWPSKRISWDSRDLFQVKR